MMQYRIHVGRSLITLHEISECSQASEEVKVQSKKSQETGDSPWRRELRSLYDDGRLRSQS